MLYCLLKVFLSTHSMYFFAYVFEQDSQVVPSFPEIITVLSVVMIHSLYVKYIV